MKDCAPHYLLWQGFWKGIGGFCAVALCTYLAQYMGIIPDQVVRLGLSLIPRQNAVLPVTVSLYLSGLFGLVLAYRLSRLRKPAPVVPTAPPQAVYSTLNAEMEEPNVPITPPQAVYSTLNIEMEEPHLEGEAFHVLKWFSTFPKGSAPVSGVEYMCQMDHSTALSCVQELWRLKFIRTVVQAPGEWNGQYAITQKGADYVRTHGT
jgi:hypothetical protein